MSTQYYPPSIIRGIHACSGAFKFRGAMNSIMALPEQQAARGVIAHSSGNHAGAVALAAKIRGIPAHIVLPTDAPQVHTSWQSAKSNTLCAIRANFGLIGHPHKEAWCEHNFVWLQRTVKEAQSQFALCQG